MDNYEDFSKLTEDEIVALIDLEASKVQPGIGFLYEELHRRRSDAASDRMERMTVSVQRMTVMMTVLTAMSVGVSAAALVIALSG